MSRSIPPNALQPDGTAAFLYALASDIERLVLCSLGEIYPAVAVFYTPAGCVARRRDKIQALCEWHIESDGADDPQALLDLTIGERWSQEAGLRPPLRRSGFTVARLEAVLRTLPGVKLQ